MINLNLWLVICLERSINPEQITEIKMKEAFPALCWGTDGWGETSPSLPVPMPGRRDRRSRVFLPPPALTVTTVVVPAVLHHRHPAPDIRTPPVGVAQHHVEEVRRADGHRHKHPGLPKDQRARQHGKERGDEGGKGWGGRKEERWTERRRRGDGEWKTVWQEMGGERDNTDTERETKPKAKL